ncbi:MAG TPA: hypothetical protein VH637_18245 [Streptosporangiaceae bacterium]|jgi:hypothetical protein
MSFITRPRARAGILAAVPVMALGALSVIPASASTPAGTVQPGPSASSRPVTLAHPPALEHVPAAVRPASVPAGATLEEHKCSVIFETASHSEESVHCADVWRTHVSATIDDVYGGNEVLCQTPGGTLMDCLSIREQAQLTSPGFATQTEAGTCGHVLGHSDCGTRRVENVATPDPVQRASTFGCSFTGVANDDIVETSDGTTAAGTVSTDIYFTHC